jgi:hypothetical protein
MATSDVITIALWMIGLGLSVSGGIIGWVLSHGSRLTAAEVRISNLAVNAESDRRRGETQFAQISAALVRIEDMVARKVDR